MRSQNNKVKNSSGSASSKSGKLGKSSNVESQLLKQLSSKMGNQGLNSRLQQSSADRDMMLHFICNQLKDIQHIQQIELDEVAQRPEWFRDVAKGENGYALPDPERWKECASLYKKAGQALCRGDVSRGKQLLEEAIKKEDATRESIPKQIERRLDSKEASQTESPVSTATEGGEICPSTREPQDLKLADKILSVRATVKNAQPVKRTRPFNWWEEMEDSEEVDTETEQQQADKKQEEADKDLEQDTVNKEQLPKAPDHDIPKE